MFRIYIEGESGSRLYLKRASRLYGNALYWDSSVDIHTRFNKEETDGLLELLSNYNVKFEQAI